MKVLINAIGAHMGGAVRHLSAFMGSLSRRATANSYSLLVQSGAFSVRDCTAIEMIEIAPSRLGSVSARMRFDLIKIPRLIKHARHEICVSLLNHGPIHCPCPHVIFQRNALYFDQHQIARLPAKARFGMLGKKWLAGSVMRNSTLIVTPGSAMQDLIMNSEHSVRQKRFAVLRHGFDAADFDERLSPVIMAQVAALKGVKILYPTHLARHKGFELLLEVMTRLKNSGKEFRLLLTIDEKDWPDGFKWIMREFESRALSSHILNLGTVPQRQMGAMYQVADMMFYPSECEAFGFSLIEAMAHGLPVVAGDYHFVREICGNAGNYYRPGDAIGAVDRLCDLMDPAKSEVAADQAIAQFTAWDWSWDRYAREFEALLDSI